MYSHTSWYYRLYTWSKNKFLIPNTTDHSYVKFEMIYRTTKIKNSLKKVAYLLKLIAGMQL